MSTAYAQQMPAQPVPAPVAQTGTLAEQIAAKQEALKDAKATIEGKSASASAQWWSNANAMTMSACVLIFGALVIAMVANQIKNHDVSDREAKMFIVVLVIVSALFVVVAGYSDSQMAPVMGLLGTIVGYVLGNRSVDSGTNGGNGAPKNPSALSTPLMRRPTGIQQPPEN